MNIEREKLASLSDGIFNLINTQVGAGLLSLPFAFAQMGYLFSFVMLIVAAICSSLGLLLIGTTAFVSVNELAVTRSTLTFGNIIQTASRCCCGYFQIALLPDLAIFFKCFFVALSYILIIGDVFTSSFHILFGVEAPRQYFTSGAILISGLLSCKGDMQKLAKSSIVSILFAFTVFVMILVYGLVPSLNPCKVDNPDPTICGSTSYFESGSWGALKAFSIFIFAFTCQQSLLENYIKLENPTLERTHKMIFRSIFISFCVYTISAAVAYSTFGSKVKSNLLLSYPKTIPIGIMQLLIGCKFILAIPMQLVPFAKSSISLLESSGWSCFSNNNNNTNTNSILSYQQVEDLEVNVEREEEIKKERNKRWQLRIVIWVTLLLLTLALFIHDLGTLFSFIGSFLSTTISYVIPALCYLYLPQKTNLLRRVSIGLLLCSLVPIVLLSVYYVHLFVSV